MIIGKFLGAVAMPGRMRWIRDFDGDLQLELKADDLSPWQSYRGHPSAVPDLPFLSPGYATFVHLLKAQWTAESVEK